MGSRVENGGGDTADGDRRIGLARRSQACAMKRQIDLIAREETGRNRRDLHVPRSLVRELLRKKAPKDGSRL